MILVSYNTCRLTLRCIETALQSSISRDMYLYVVDNGSTDGTQERLRAHYSSVTLKAESVNLGYGGGINQGASVSTSDYLLISNTDVEYDSEAIERMASFLDHNPRVGAVGPQQYYPSGKWQRSYGIPPSIKEGIYNLLGITSLRHSIRRALWPRVIVDRKPKAVAYIDGAVMMIRRDAFNEIAGFDVSFTHFAEEVDFCVRLQNAGWHTFMLPSARVMHIRGASSTKLPERRLAFAEKLVRSKVQFVKKHGGPTEVVAYSYLQALHSIKMAVLWKIVAMLLSGARREHVLTKQRIFLASARLWYRQSRPL